jgi:hypothetical protein
LTVIMHNQVIKDAAPPKISIIGIYIIIYGFGEAANVVERPICYAFS